jgi:UPF0716 protein FxsA
MFRLLFIFFIVVPVIEIAVIMQVGSLLGTWPTVAIIIFTAWFGAKKVREQGLATLNSVQTKMTQGEMPSDEIIGGLMLLIAGVLLLTPGFVTDALGLALLFEPVRQRITKAVQKHFIVAQRSQQVFTQEFEYQVVETNNEIEQSPERGNTIEGDFERKN